MTVLFVLCALAQEEIPVEEALAKIEKRPAPLETVTADIDIRGGDLEPGDRVVGRIECVRGVSLHRWFGLLSSSGAGILQEDFADLETLAYQIAVTSGEGATFLAARTASSSVLPLDRGPMGSTLLKYGIEFGLVDVALHPRKLRLLGGELRAVKRKEGDREFSALSVRWKERDYSLTWFFDAKTGRLEKGESRSRGRSTAAECVSFASVGGVEVPQRVRIRRNRIDREDLEIVWSNFRTRKDQPSRPSWVSDPALPLASADSVETVRSRLKADPRNAALAMAFSNAARKREWAAEVSSALKTARESAPDSPILAAALTPSPALQAWTEGKSDAAARGLEGIAPRLVPPLRLASVTSAEELLAELAKVDVVRRIDLLHAVAPPPTRRTGVREGVVKPEWLEPLQASGRPEAFLIAAREYSRKGEQKKAAALYAKLAEVEEVRAPLRSEFQAFCAIARDDALVLTDRILEEVTLVEVIASAADAWYGGKEPAKGERAVRRLLAVLREEGPRSGVYRRPEVVKPLLERLLAADRAADARDVLMLYSDRANATQFLYDRDNIVARLLPDEDSRYEYAKRTLGQVFYLNRLSLTPGALLALAKKRIDSSARDESDIEVVAAFVVDDSLRREAKGENLAALLERGVQAYPNRSDFRERLGDAYALGGRFADAAKSYEEALKGMKEAPPADPWIAVIRRVETSRAKGAFSPAKPVICKLAYACLKGDRRDDAVRAVQRYEKDFGDAASLEGAAQAYELLELLDPLLRIKKALFLERRQSTEPSSTSGTAAAAVELGKLYLKARRVEEASVVAEMASELTKGEPRSSHAVDDLRADVAKALREDDVLLKYLEGRFPAVEEKRRREVEDLVAQLDGDQPFARQEADEKIRALGPAVVSVLKAHLSGGNGEATLRVRAILLDWARGALREKFLAAP